MADAWLPGAGYLHTKHDGGALKGGAPRAIWHTSESDPTAVSARSVVQRLEQTGYAAHLVWNPRDGEVVQMVPATRAARMLDGEVDQEGRVCIQIVVIGNACEPFTSGPMKGLGQILAWLDLWGVARTWPAGQPLPSPQAYHASRCRRLWARGGYFGRSQVPQTAGPDPGAVDIEKISGATVGRPTALPLTAEVPRPRDAMDVPEPDTRPRLLRPSSVPAQEPERASSRS